MVQVSVFIGILIPRIIWYGIWRTGLETENWIDSFNSSRCLDRIYLNSEHFWNISWLFSELKFLHCPQKAPALIAAKAKNHCYNHHLTGGRWIDNHGEGLRNYETDSVFDLVVISPHSNSFWHSYYFAWKCLWCCLFRTANTSNRRYRDYDDIML